MRLLALLIIALASAENCKKFTCKQLTQDTCAAVLDDTLYVNTIPCNGTDTCSIAQITNWSMTHLPRQGPLQCTGLEGIQFQMPYNETDAQDMVNCGERNYDERLVVEGHPKRCATNSDCLTQDGQEGLCTCGLDEFKWCQPKWGSMVFDNFWLQCEAHGGKMTKEEYYQWAFYHDNYIKLNSGPDCIRNLYEHRFFPKPVEITLQDSMAGVLTGLLLILFY